MLILFCLKFDSTANLIWFRYRESPSKTQQEGTNNLNDTNENAALFEALRDSIYSEVATLIAMNESRPHYLIELFRELQLFNSDYLRQRALYSLQELVTLYLTEENMPLQSNPSQAAKGGAFTKETLPSSQQWVASASEQTPSDMASIVTTTDDEEDGGESQALRTLAQQIQNNEMYDYAELADSQSEGNLSTPGSHYDIPFAAEDLGNTVINLEDVGFSLYLFFLQTHFVTSLLFFFLLYFSKCLCLYSGSSEDENIRTEHGRSETCFRANIE